MLFIEGFDIMIDPKDVNTTTTDESTEVSDDSDDED